MFGVCCGGVGGVGVWVFLLGVRCFVLVVLDVWSWWGSMLLLVCGFGVWLRVGIGVGVGGVRCWCLFKVFGVVVWCVFGVWRLVFAVSFFS